MQEATIRGARVVQVVNEANKDVLIKSLELGLDIRPNLADVERLAEMLWPFDIPRKRIGGSAV